MKAVFKNRMLADALAFCVGLLLVWLALFFFRGPHAGPHVLEFLHDGNPAANAWRPYSFNWHTLFRCLSVGVIWVCLRDISFRISALVGWRSLSALLTIAAAFGAWYVGIALRNFFDLQATKLVVVYSFLLVCLGWALASEFFFAFPSRADPKIPQDETTPKCAAPNGGPAKQLGNSGVSGEPPSVS